MKITALESVNGKPYVTKEEACNQLGVKDKRTVNTRLKEIRREIDTGRYSDYAIIEDGTLLWVSYLVLMDYLKYRRQLNNKNMRKHVPRFDPQKLAESIGWYKKEGT